MSSATRRNKSAVARYEQAMRAWQSAFLEAKRGFASLPELATTELIQPSIDLDATTFEAVTRHQTFSGWIRDLTPRQRQFVEAETGQSIKLRGPAGSGKTLALCLKALRELYKAREENRSIRILFSTHSWAVAEQVDRILRKLDESGEIREIDVYPLLEIARDRLPSERSSEALSVLGEDSLSGKQLQLERIDAVLENLKRGDWIAYKGHCTDALRARVESSRGSTTRNSLVWDLMMEFSSVLAAQGILPGSMPAAISVDSTEPLDDAAQGREREAVRSPDLLGVRESVAE